MGADEFHEWVAYFTLQDTEYRQKIEDTIDMEIMDPADYILKHYYSRKDGKSNK